MTTPHDIATTGEPATEAPIWQPSVAPAAETGEAVSASDAVPDVGGPLASTLVPMLMPAAAPVPARRAGSTTVLLVVAAMIALGGVGFAVGRTTAAQTTTAAANGQLAAQGADGAPALGAIPSGAVPAFDNGGGDGQLDGASTLSGTVTSVTSSSITIELASGQTVTVATGSSTVYNTQTSASSSAVTAGASVIVQTSTAASASAGTTGSRTATNVIVTGK
jgi:hypothetical protein